MKTDFSIGLGARIRHFRELAGLTQLQLSEMLPCEPSTLAHYETGKNQNTQLLSFQAASQKSLLPSACLTGHIPGTCLPGKNSPSDISPMLLL